MKKTQLPFLRTNNLCHFTTHNNIVQHYSSFFFLTHKQWTYTYCRCQLLGLILAPLMGMNKSVSVCWCMPAQPCSSQDRIKYMWTKTNIIFIPRRLSLVPRDATSRPMGGKTNYVYAAGRLHCSQLLRTSEMDWVGENGGSHTSMASCVMWA